jgi:DNA polymerase
VRPQPTPGREPTPAATRRAAFRRCARRSSAAASARSATRDAGGAGRRPQARQADVRRRAAGRPGRPAGQALRRPAGSCSNRALAELGIERRDAYVTNAVKHFKFELRGKRRIHKTPAQQEAAACLHWLESEIALVDPAPSSRWARPRRAS